MPVTFTPAPVRVVTPAILTSPNTVPPSAVTASATLKSSKIWNSKVSPKVAGDSNVTDAPSLAS